MRSRPYLFAAVHRGPYLSLAPALGDASARREVLAGFSRLRARSRRSARAIAGIIERAIGRRAEH